MKIVSNVSNDVIVRLSFPYPPVGNNVGIPTVNH